MYTLYQWNSQGGVHVHCILGINLYMYTSLCTQLGKDRDIKQPFQHTQGAPQLIQASVIVVERSK